MSDSRPDSPEPTSPAPPDAAKPPARHDGATATPRPGDGATATPRTSDGATTPRLRVSAFPGATESAARPLLASDALMDDLAPIEPWAAAARVFCVVAGLVFMAWGGVPASAGEGIDHVLPAIFLGGLALVAGLAPVNYRHRAVAMVVFGGVTAALGLRNAGPASGMAVGGEAWGFFRFIAATMLPAALLFRARYRAYAKARWILGASLLATLPFLGRTVALLLVEELGWSHLGAAVGAIAIVASLAGFMGSETTGAASYTAFGVIAALAAELALEALTPGGPATVARAAGILEATVGFGAASLATALGAFQLLAWRLAADARRIDTHVEGKREKPVPPSTEDWSTRG